MRVVVCLKPVPDPREPWRYAPDRHTLDRDSTEGILNPLDDLALEAVLRWRDAGQDVDCWALTMGASGARDTLKRALAKGADHAVWLHDPDLAGSDLVATARALTAALHRIGDVALVLMGDRSLDAATGALGAMLAEGMDWPHVSGACSLDRAGDRLEVTRRERRSRDRLQVPLPAVVSVAGLAGAPRLPSFTGIMATGKKDLIPWTRADLGLGPDEVGLAGSGTEVRALVPPPAREPRVLVGTPAELGQQLAAALESGRSV